MTARYDDVMDALHLDFPADSEQDPHHPHQPRRSLTLRRKVRPAQPDSGP